MLLVNCSGQLAMMGGGFQACAVKCLPFSDATEQYDAIAELEA